jgi:hypothetical protein
VRDLRILPGQLEPAWHREVRGPPGFATFPPMSLIDELNNERNRQTCGKILRPDALEPLEWREVRSLFHELGNVTWQLNGDLKVTCNGHVIILHPSPSKDVEKMEERIELRRFLERLQQPMLELEVMGA